jgi:hypothetical protein
MSAAPYVPFRTFLAALESLERACPSQLDRSLWPSYSGAIQGQLLGAFRFLSLIDEANCPTPELRELLAKRDSRRALLRRLIEKHYAPLVALGLERTSPRQLDDAVRRFGYTGVTHQKAASFFLQAARYSGLPLSALLLAKTRGAGPHRHRLPAPEAAAAAKTVRLKSGGTVTLSTALDLFTLSTADREFVFALIDKVQSYAG